jgi:hypothetical protein
MNIFLWTLQVILAWLCIAGGIFQMFKIEQLKTNVAAMRALPRRLWAMLGAVGVLAGFCLIWPGALQVFPIVTVTAAIAVAVQSLVITALYFRYRDFAPMMFSAAMIAMASVVAYGR